MMSNKWVYTFGDGAAEGRADMKNLLGGKGANLAEMSSIGLPGLRLRPKFAPTTTPTAKPVPPSCGIR